MKIKKITLMMLFMLIFGALNTVTIGIIDLNLIEKIFGNFGLLQNLIYFSIGFSVITGIYLLLMEMNLTNNKTRRRK
jgi:uncharacterized membrane protein YuzA (DUF378 family)